MHLTELFLFYYDRLVSKKLLLLGAILVLLVAIPLTVFLAQKQQETRSRAAASTTLSFTPTSSQGTPIQKQVGQKVSLDVMMDPGTNWVSIVKLQINYDKEKLATSSADTTCESSLCPNLAAFPSVFNEPTYTPGNISVILSIGADTTKVSQAATKVATITFEAINSTTTPTQVSFGNTTKVFSFNEADPESESGESVLSSTSNAFIAIAAGPILTPTPTPVAGTNQPPVCSALNVDRTPSGTAPFSITFTANGTDSDGTINKVTFDFGDGPVKDVTEGGKIGTKAVSAQIAHTYNNSGTFEALAILTDDKGGISASSATCTQTITVTPSVGGEVGATQSATPTPLPTSMPTSTPTPTPIQQLPIEEPGPSNTIIGVGIVGAILSIVGAILFFAL